MTTTQFYDQLINLEISLERFAFRLTTRKSEAEDLVQETFLKALMYQDKYVNNGNFKAWTFVIMKNTFINNYRRQIRENTIRDQTTELFFINQSSFGDSNNPETQYSTKEINANIDCLKEMYRTPFKLHINGFKYKEIAEKLNLNIGTVKSRIFLSRKQLMNQLER